MQVDLCKQNGATPLYIASERAELGVVKALLHGRAAVDQPTKLGVR